MTEYTREARARSPLAWLAIATAGVSAVGLLILLVGIVLGIEGAQEGEEGPAIFGIAWFSYLLGGLAALVTGAIAFVVGRRRGEPGTERAGIVALGYFVIALVVFLIAAVA